MSYGVDGASFPLITYSKLEPHDIMDDEHDGHKRKAVDRPDDEACNTENALLSKQQIR